MSQLQGPSVAPAAGGPARQLVVLLHGVGADGQDLISLSAPFSRVLPHARFVAPNGPEPCDMAPMGYQWFSLQDRRPDAMLEGIRKSVPMLNAFIDGELERDGLGDESLALIGFSQGTMMSLYLAPRRQRQLAGVVGYSGALIGAESLGQEGTAKPPFLLIHGDADPVVPVQALHAAVGGLKAAGLEVQWHVSPGLPHGIDPDGIERGGAFLSQVFGDKTA